ncbi:MAG: hypothetical protein U0L19_11005 [Bacteroidales bacterium]|nr:hypothetical protein [Bacteroidales bacterium]
MNKIKFSAGGQPVFLDDLQLLQDNYSNMIAFLAESSVGSNSPILLHDYDPVIQRINSDGTIDVYVAQNKILHDGVIVDIHEKTFTGIETSKDIYVAITTQDNTSRVFQDGSTKQVRTSSSAILISTSVGVSFRMRDLYRFGRFRTDRFALLNGYYGYISVVSGKLIVSIETTAKEWDDLSTILFVVSDSTWASQLADKSFDVIGNESVQITFDGFGRCLYKYKVSSIYTPPLPQKIQIEANIPQ